MKKLFSLLMMMIMVVSMMAIPVWAAADDPIVVNVIPESSATGSSAEGYKMIQDWILENTGVLVNAITLDGTDDKNQKNALLNGTTRIDVWWDSNWMQYKANDMLKNMKDYIDLIPNTMAYWANYGGLMSVTDKDGNVWGLPRHCNRVFEHTFIREDYLKALGYTEDQYPTTMEQLEEYLYKVKAAAGTNGIPENVIPMITRSRMDDMEYHFLGGYTAYGRSNWQDEDGLIKPYYLQDGYLEFLQQMKKWRDDGIFLQDNVSWNTNTVREMLAGGRVASSSAYSTDLCNQYITLRQNVPGAKWWTPVEGMTRNGELMESQIKGEPAAMCFNVNTPDEVIKAYLKVLEFLYGDWANNYSAQIGLQGLYWDYDVETYGEEAKTLHIVKTLETAAQQPKYSKDFWFSIGLPTEADCVMYDADGVQNMQNEWIRHQGDTFSAKEAFDSGIYYNTVDLYENVMLASDLETAVKENTILFFTGEPGYELTEENWAKFIQRLYDEFELQEYCEELTRQYNEAKGL